MPIEVGSFDEVHTANADAGHTTVCASDADESINPPGPSIATAKGASKTEYEAYELPAIPTRNVTMASFGMDTSPIQQEASNIVQRRRELLSYCPLLWVLFMQGWNDGTTGPLLPIMQEHYHIGYFVVSLIFVVNCVGFVSGAVANIVMTDRLGFGKTMVIGAIMQSIGYCVQAPAPPFPVFAMGFFFSGFGLSLLSAGAITFVVNLKNSPTKMGLLLASYGVGAFISPLVATKFVSTVHWSHHYFVSFAGAAANLISLCFAFRFQRMDDILRKSGQVVRDTSSSPSGGLYGQMFKLKAVHLLGLFALAYVGTEVSIGGWIVTFIIDERDGGPSSGYVSSGFFAGLAVGRLALLWVNSLVGERRVVFIYIAMCIALEITIWFVPSLVGNAIAVAFIGFLFGPIYPIVSTVAGRLVPRWLLNGAIGWIGGLGNCGSAFLPFVTGAISSKYGVKSLQPLVVAAMSSMMILWAAVPPDVRRSE